MSRVLVPAQEKWYDELKAVAYYGETEFERSIRQHLVTLFPDHYVFPFKASVTSSTTAITKRPDLAMIRRDLAAWGIIEVELSEHNLKHVLDQTRVFLNGNYNAPEIAEYAKSKLAEHCGKNIALNRLTNLFAKELPKVLVISDSHSDEWKQALNKAGIGLCVLEIYKNTNGHHLYRTFGQYPPAITQEAHCRRHKSLVNHLEIIGAFMFHKTGKDNEVYVFFDDVLTRWVLVEDDGKRYLQFVGKFNPLSASDTYGLFADKSNNYYFQRS